MARATSHPALSQAGSHPAAADKPPQSGSILAANDQTRPGMPRKICKKPAKTSLTRLNALACTW